jgi:hypothetical protein
VTNLCHNELDVLALETLVINLLPIILFFLFFLLVLDLLALLLGSSGELSLDAVGTLRLTELGGSVGLSLGVEVLDLGLTEDAFVLLGLTYRTRNGIAYIQVLLEGDLYTSGWLITNRICPHIVNDQYFQPPIPPTTTTRRSIKT